MPPKTTRLASGGSNAFIKCVADPFHAAPAHLPDEFQGLSTPMKLRTSTVITPLAGGLAAWAFQPSLLASYQNATAVTAAGVVTWNAAYTPHDDYTALEASYSQYRIISVGVKVSYIGQADQAQGEIVVLPFQASQNVTGAVAPLPANINDWRDNVSATTHSVPSMHKDIAIALHNYDRPPFATSTTGNFVANFPQVAIGFLGVPEAVDKAQFRIEYFVNIEAIPRQNSIHQHLATRSSTSTAGIAVSRRLQPMQVSGGGTDAIVDMRMGNVTPSPINTPRSRGGSRLFRSPGTSGRKRKMSRPGSSSYGRQSLMSKGRRTRGSRAYPVYRTKSRRRFIR